MSVSIEKVDISPKTNVRIIIPATIIITIIIIYMKKLLYSDWLRAVQFKCDNSAESVTQV